MSLAHHPVSRIHHGGKDMVEGLWGSWSHHRRKQRTMDVYAQLLSPFYSVQKPSPWHVSTHSEGGSTHLNEPNLETPPGIKQEPCHLEDIQNASCHQHSAPSKQSHSVLPVKDTFGESRAKIEEAATASWFHRQSVGLRRSDTYVRLLRRPCWH